MLMEIGDIIAPAVPHSSEKADCPFCPEGPEPEFTTYPGEKNNSDALRKIMDNLNFLEEKQFNVRPKKGKQNLQPPTSFDQKKPNPIYNDQQDGYGPYSCEAHRLISGKQALGTNGHNFEQWIANNMGGTIKKDTGYSVNNADNGLRAPSIPEKFKEGKWGPMNFKMKYKIAKKSMEAGLPQFHKGHHAIGDPNDPDKLKHQKYDQYLKSLLQEINGRMHGWSAECPLYAKGEKTFTTQCSSQASSRQFFKSYTWKDMYTSYTKAYFYIQVRFSL